MHHLKGRDDNLCCLLLKNRSQQQLNAYIITNDKYTELADDPVVKLPDEYKWFVIEGKDITKIIDNGTVQPTTIIDYKKQILDSLRKYATAKYETDKEHPVSRHCISIYGDLQVIH